MDCSLEHCYPKVNTHFATFYTVPFVMFCAIYLKSISLLRGVCRCCGSELESIKLSAEEYQELKDRVMTDVIQGRDVFNKTTPEVRICTKTASFKNGFMVFLIFKSHNYLRRD